LLGSLIAARVTVTLRRLTTAADTVRTTGRLDVEVPRGGDDEVSRLGSAFGSMLSTLDRSRAEQQRLVQDAGHELRTPLTSLRTNLDVLRRHPGLPDDERVRIVDDLHREVAEMAELVDEIVTVATGVATDEAATEFSLGDAVRTVVERSRRRTGRPFDLVADESPVQAQQAAIERAISNLLDNATKFDESGAAIEVRVEGGAVTVRDHGPGIPAGDLEVIFDRFHRAAAAQSMPGSGLGLSIVRDVVERNGGTVSAANEPSGGAVVGFRLPLSPA
jgi:two-component system sensor histidine kinase MprB